MKPTETFRGLLDLRSICSTWRRGGNHLALLWLIGIPTQYLPKRLMVSVALSSLASFIVSARSAFGASVASSKEDFESGLLSPEKTISCQSSPSTCFTLHMRHRVSCSFPSLSLNFMIRRRLASAGLPSANGLKLGDINT